MPMCCTWTRSSPTWKRRGRRCDETARHIWAVPLLTHPSPPAARMAGRGARRALGDPEHRVLLALGKHSRGRGRLGREAARRAGVGRARLREPDRHLPPDEGARPLRRARHGGAEQRSVRTASRDHRGMQGAQMGVHGAQREQHAALERAAGGPGEPHHPQRARHDRESDRLAAGRLARLGTAGNLGHARISRRRTLRVRLRLGERRSALRYAARERTAARVRALQHREQRQTRVRKAQPHGRRIPRHDRAPVRRALRRRRRIGPRHGDRAASLSHRRAAPDRSARRGARAHSPARRRVARDRGGDRAALYGPKADALRPLKEERSMAGRLAGRVAIITGGGHGIGKAYALGLAREDAKIVVAEIDAIAADAVAADLKRQGFEAIAVRTDVADRASAEAMAKRAVEAFGRIDILVNNAAIFATVPMSRSPFDEIEIEEWDRMMAVNLRGMWLASRAAVPHMRKRGYGKIINISSGTALKGSASRIHYVTSKAGVLGFTRTLAQELGKDGICVNCVAPGSTLSEENPSEGIVRMRSAAAADRALKRLQKPEDLVGAIVFFASPDSDFITGQTLVVDGGACMH